MKVMAEDLWFPEGPVYLEDGSIIVVEIRRKTLTRIWKNGKKTIVADLEGGPNGAAIGPDGSCFVANNGGFEFKQRNDGVFATSGAAKNYKTGSIQKVDLSTGEFSTVYTTNGQFIIRGPNDLAFDCHGGFYFTDPGKTRERTWDRGCVCYAKADGTEIKEIIFPITKPNGVGLSPDQTKLYVAETESARLWEWEISEPGVLAPQEQNAPTPHGGRLVYVSPKSCRFDSLAVDVHGNVCVGTLDMGGITIIDVKTGTANFVKVPGDTHITNLCFGGNEQNKAYITQSYAGRLIEMDWPPKGTELN